MVRRLLRASHQATQFVLRARRAPGGLREGGRGRKKCDICTNICLSQDLFPTIANRKRSLEDVQLRPIAPEVFQKEYRLRRNIKKASKTKLGLRRLGNIGPHFFPRLGDKTRATTTYAEKCGAPKIACCAVRNQRPGDYCAKRLL